MVKIGLTTRNPRDRAAELASSSGVPLPFAVAWARAVTDCATVERAVHRMLDDKRVSGKREFFRVDVGTARQVIEAAAGSALGRRFRPRPAVFKGGQGSGEGSGAGILTGFGLAASVVALVAVLVLFKPGLPHWLPGPVRDGFLTVESW